MMRMKVIGYKHLDANLKRLSIALRGDKKASAAAAGAQVVAHKTQDNIRTIPLIDTWELHDSVIVRKVNQFRSDVVVEADHGAPHEYGARIPVTPRSRRFFWAMYRESGDEKWKAMALSRKTHFILPARPFMRPALIEEADAALKATAIELRGYLEGAVK